MEEQNNITPWKYIKQHWKLILLVFLFPIMINALTFIPNFQVFDKPNSWTEVWAEYGGALLSAGIALVILYKQQKQNEKVNEAILKQNHEENEQNRKNNEEQNIKNREYQKMSLIYQRKCDWLKDLRKALTNLYIAEDLGKIVQMNDKIKAYYKKEYGSYESYNAETLNITNDLLMYFNNLKNADVNLKFLFESDDKLDEEEKNIINQIRFLETFFFDYINEIKWMVSIIPPTLYHISSSEFNKYVNNYNEYAKDCHIFNQYLMKILYKYNFDIKTHINHILSDMYKLLEANVVPYVGRISYHLLKYEETKVDNYLDE